MWWASLLFLGSACFLCECELEAQQVRLAYEGSVRVAVFVAEFDGVCAVPVAFDADAFAVKVAHFDDGAGLPAGDWCAHDGLSFGSGWYDVDETTRRVDRTTTTC